MPVYSISVADNLQIPFDYSCDYTKKKKKHNKHQATAWKGAKTEHQTHYSQTNELLI